VPGTKIVLTTLGTLNALTGESANFIGVVITHWDDLAISKNFRDIDLPNALGPFGAKALVTLIPIANQLEVSQRTTPTKGAKAYAELAEEVKRYVHVGRETINK
jgi:hypothetical protein